MSENATNNIVDENAESVDNTPKTDDEIYTDELYKRVIASKQQIEAIKEEMCTFGTPTNPEDLLKYVDNLEDDIRKTVSAGYFTWEIDHWDFKMPTTREVMWRFNDRLDRNRSRKGIRTEVRLRYVGASKMINDTVYTDKVLRTITIRGTGKSPYTT